MAGATVDLVFNDNNSDGKGSDNDSQVYVSTSLKKKLSKSGKSKFTSAPRGEISINFLICLYIWFACC